MGVIPMSQRVPDDAASMRVNNRHAVGRSQLDLFDLPTSDDEKWNDIRKLVAETIDLIGTKQAAYDLDMQPSLLLHMLAERDRHRISGRLLAYAITHAKDTSLIAYLAACGGQQVVAPEVITPEEELRRLKEAMGECLSAEVREVIARKVRR